MYICCSYDQWLPDCHTDLECEPARDISQWEVTARWLLDLDEFNEWMNEEDYLFEDEGVSCNWD